MNWAKNGLFVLLCLFGLGWIGSSLLRRDRVEKPLVSRTLRLVGADRTADAALPPLPLRPDELAVVAAVDAEFQKAWAEHQLQPAAPADSLTIARRLSLSLTGTIPSLEEIRALERQSEDRRRAWWLSHLLEDRRFADYTAERFTRAYVGTEDGPFIVFRRNRLAAWLSDQIAENVPYDAIVRHLLADEGVWTDTPAVNFISVTLDNGDDEKPDPIKLAARTSRAFLGTRIDCLQCHDDNLGTMNLGTPDAPVGGKQTHFHELAAFFSEPQKTRRGMSDRRGRAYSVKYLHAEQETDVVPRVPFAAENFSGHGRRREQLAAWVTHPENKPFARTLVNRMWAILFGRPLVDPIDDIPLQGELPPGMELLADDFAAHRFDLQRLIRIIVSTRAFQMESAADFEITPEHEKHWAVFPIIRLRPEQMAGAIIQSSQVSTIDSDAHILWKLIKFGQTNEFVKRYGDTGTDEFVSRSGTIPQRLLMMNGELVKERTQENPVLNLATRLAAVAPNDPKAIEAAYLAILTRRPTPEESEHFVAKLKQTKRTSQSMEDIYWTLVNSTEFSWNH